MAALEDIPWIDSMAPSSLSQDHGFQPDSQPPTVAAFSPTTISGSSLTSRQRSSIIVHRKSPLLVATPPPVTRALAYSHPFILPLNKLLGLLTWTSGDPWQSFLFLAGFWTVVLYSDAIILWTGPILLVLGLILGMYWRRYSPLSSRAVDKSHQRAASDTTPHHKSLDEIVDTLRTFTTRCNILLEPLVDLTDFLSTQRTATSATTRPALTALFFRILFVTPLWILLTFPPIYLITTRRVIMIIGTLMLTYHSRPVRVSRVILWRSLIVRRIFSVITGLSFSTNVGGDDKVRASKTQGPGHAVDIATRRRGGSSGVRFTFIIYENQRRWLGIGWTYSLFPSERGSWTDEHLNMVPPKDEFELPDVQSGNAEWRWIDGGDWRIDGADDSSMKSDPKSSDGGGWIYYDNKWNDGRRGQDGWDRYTRRRKWYRDAELVEIIPETEDPPTETASNLTQALQNEKASSSGADASTVDADAQSLAPSSKARKRRWFGGSKSVSDKNSSNSAPPTSNNSSVDLGKITSATRDDPKSGPTASRPINIQHARKSSNIPGAASHSSSAGREGSLHGSGTNSDSVSVRNKEIHQAQDRLDRWGTRATGGTERAEREMGLGDEVNMGLS
ncbi:hypothetical protein ASPWEDRAFT_50267 [Aspergillus wentii DTO 134E9]|uniref:Peroxin/Ferlin domain-containing protein n=1 Tax=Aspergillus wentii DTO 134E9 TaxID=1073089 RepID=A0A1L9RPL5_ASPWE|nr:uncharacterized protein ASPWEDRAFT_50267 [Aspergillus wentii DTO 134E9]OJJ36842.1 hypothetical protein ASPWEDRAFT_50267 [Aspergillus wentii DTO 134E9]